MPTDKDLASQLPVTFAQTRESLRALACYVISPARKARTGRIGLRAHRGGISTPLFDDGSRISVRRDRLCLDPGDCVAITTLRAAAAFVGLAISSDPGVGADLPAYDPDVELLVDPEASQRLGDWYALADGVLAGLAAEEPGVTEAQLWPEHFDLAAQLDLGNGDAVNIGFSPGDGELPEPYLYVGPHDPTRQSGPYWNASFGATLGYHDLMAAASPAQAARLFIGQGLDLLRAP
ncbi:MAG: hypothetical protein M3N98_00760 [Actinomycetota bacterium]|nr:hypothetical protein [Actinomycetota bacterium]